MVRKTLGSVAFAAALLVLALFVPADAQSNEPTHRVTDARGESFDVVLPITVDTIPTTTTSTTTTTTLLPTTTTTQPAIVINVLDDPSAFGWPDETNTGPSDPSLLPAVKGPSIFTEFDGQVIENFWTGWIVVRHHNVTIRNGIIQTTNQTGAALIENDLAFSPRGLTVENVEIFCSDPNDVPRPCASKAIRFPRGDADRPVLIRANNIHHTEDGPAPIRGENVTIEDNYIHDLWQYEDSHNDGVVATMGSIANTVIRHNTIEILNSSGNVQQTSAVAIFVTPGMIADDILIEENLMVGGSFIFHIDDQGGGSATNVRILNNRYGRGDTGNGGQFGIYAVDGSPLRSGNVWDDDNSPAN